MKQKKQTKILKHLLAAFLAFSLMLCVPMLKVTAAGSYSVKDMFGSAASIKGVQGILMSTYGYGENNGRLPDMGRMSHSFWNVNVNENIISPNHEWVKKGFVAPYEFEGESFYFLGTDGTFDTIRKMNQSNLSVSISFQATQTELSDNYGNVAIDTWNRSGRKNQMYAMAVSGYNGKAVRAYWHWFMEKLVKTGCHVDNFILGNEVNVPDSWNYCGSANPNTVVSLYTDAFYEMWDAVREYTDVSRCSVCLDHTWNWTYPGIGFGGRTFLDLFDSKLKEKNGGDTVDWSVSYHLYPAVLYYADIWNEHRPALGPMTTDSVDTPFVDGSNLHVLTDYVRNHFGVEHRIMLTEQGFTKAQGDAVQAASLAYSYYAAMYDPMVDSFVIHYNDDGSACDDSTGQTLSMDFRLGSLAQEVYRRIDSGNPEDAEWIASQCLPTIGVSSWNEIIPNFGQEADKYTPPVNTEEPQIRAFVSRMYTVVLGRQAEEAGLNDWTRRLVRHKTDGAGIANGFIMSDEFKNKEVSDEAYVDILYRTFFDRVPDEGGKADWLGKLANGNSRAFVLAGFVNSGEFDKLCGDYGIKRGEMHVLETAISSGVQRFVNRCYVKVLGRDAEAAGLKDWTGRIARGEESPESVARLFFFSEEYASKDTDNETFVETLYQTFMDRESDSAGKADWVRKLYGGVSREEVLEGFSRSEEFAKILKSFGL